MAVEQLALWARQEALALQRLQESNHHSVSPVVRAAALDLVQQAIALGASDAAWSVPNGQSQVLGACYFEVAQLLDGGGMASPEELSTKKVLSRALASWGLSLKLATSEVRQLRPQLTSRIISCASKISSHFGDDAITWEDVLAEERFLIVSTTLSGSTVPTVMCWISTFLSRFFALAGSPNESSSARAAAYVGEQYAAMIVREIPYSADVPPQRMALGICGTVLAALGHIPSDSLRATEIRATDWDDTLLSMKEFVADSNDMVPLVPQELRTLELATQHDEAAIKDAARELVDILRSWRAPEDSES